MRAVALVLLSLASAGYGRRVHKIVEQDTGSSDRQSLDSKALATLLQAFTPSAAFQFNIASGAGHRPPSITRNHVASHARPRFSHPVAEEDKKEEEEPAGHKMPEAKKEEEEPAGHKVPTKGGMPKIDPEEMAVQKKLMEHQKTAKKLNASVEVRSLVQYNHGYAVMSTHSTHYEGYPSGSVVGFAPDGEGSPVFSFSSMSTHTQDLLKDKKCSLTVASKEFKGAADGRVNLLGECEPIKDEEEIAASKALYREKHPGAFWTDFDDFTWFRMKVQNIRFVGGFARAGSVTAEDYYDSKPDPISAIQGRVASHMNDDHREATVAIVRNFVGLDVQDAEITALDSLGMYVKVSRTPKAAGQMQQFKIRVPWTKPLDDPKQVKGMIVQMTKESAEFMPEKEGDKEEEKVEKEEATA